MATGVSGRPVGSAADTGDANPDGESSFRELLAATARVLETGRQPAHAAFLARALNGLATVVPALSADALAAAARAPSDYAALLSTCRDPEALAPWRQQDPLAEARLRGLEVRERLLAAEGGALTGEQAAARLGISRQAVDKRRRAGRLLALQGARRGYVYPAWQFDVEGPGGMLPGFEVTLAALGVRGPCTQLSWFLNGEVRLRGVRPLDALRRGRGAAVARAAAAYGEQGAA